MALRWHTTIEHFNTIIHPWVSISYLACCLLGDPTDDPLDALHPHLELHQALLVAPHIVSTCLSQVATNPRSTSRSLGLAPCPCPHLQLLAFLVSQLTARHICTHPPPPPCLSFPLTPLPKPPLTSSTLITSGSSSLFLPAHSCAFSLHPSHPGQYGERSEKIGSIHEQQRLQAAKN